MPFEYQLAALCFLAAVAILFTTVVVVDYSEY